MPAHTRISIHCNDCATRNVCILGRLPPADIEALQPVIVRRRFHVGEKLVLEGELTDTVRVVKIGNVFGYRRGLDGNERPIGIAGRGAVFGLFGYFGQANQVSGVAASATRVCEIPHAALRRVARTHPRFGDRLARVAVQSCGLIASWSEAMRVRGVVNQLAYTLVLLAQAQTGDVVDLPTHTALAELLGTTRETIARAMSTLRGEGAIRLLDRRKCEVNAQTLLQRLQQRPANARAPA